MAQIRIEKANCYTTVSNETIQSPDLSLKAKGLLVYMLSLPEDWDYSISGLSAKCKEGTSAIRSAVQELMEAGYITRAHSRQEDGTYSGYEYIVYEQPQPACENPTLDFPAQENRTQQNKNLTKQELNKPPIVPQEGDEPAGEKAPEERPATSGRQISKPKYRPEWFEPLWQFYPVHKARQDACRAWDKLKPDRDFCRMMYESVRLQKYSEQWVRDNGAYIPHFSRWLNGRKWEDEVRLAIPPGLRDDFDGGWAADPEVTD